MKASPLERFRTDLSRCVKCGTCNAVCPSYQQLRNESFSPRGRMALIQAALQGTVSISSAYRDRLATCTDCLACSAACPCTVPVTRIIQAAKEQAIAEAGTGIIGKLLAQALQHPSAFRAASRLAPLLLHYNHVRESGRAKQRSGVKAGSRGVVVFYPGCAIDSFHHDIGAAVRRVLTSLGYEVLVPRGLQCCGKPLLSLGDRTAAEKLAAKNANILRAAAADAIVTACASCGMMFKNEYPDLLLGDEMPPVLDIHEFLAPRIAELKLHAIGKSATWHEPCHLGRGQGLSKAARIVLRAIPGLDLREMSGADQCCGFGGVMRIAHHNLSDGIAEKKVRAIRETGATVVITGCPGCRMQLANAQGTGQENIEVLHTIQVIADALDAERD